MNPTSLTLFSSPHILDKNYDNVAVVMHEFGHTVAQTAGFFPGEILPWYAKHVLYDLRYYYTGGRSDIPLEKLAFSEGWADFYSAAAQALAGAPNPGYGVYLAAADQPRGEMDEIGVMQLLWDLSEPAGNTTLSYGGLTGVQALYKLIADDKIERIEDLWTALTALATPQQQAAYGALFASHGMAPMQLNMGVGTDTNNYWGAGDPLPVFRWTIPSGYDSTQQPGVLQSLNQFQVLVFDVDPTTGAWTQSGGSVILSPGNAQLQINGSAASWAPDDSEWQQIISTGCDTKAFVVLGSYVNTWIGFGGTQEKETSVSFWSGLCKFTVDPSPA
ncbi:MAG: hypothetical protein ACP5XB_00975 [Isosphaeraceae bacterium]